MSKNYKVYYIVQTLPIFKVCGHTFNKKEAQMVADYVKELTGRQGNVIEFSRDELVNLEY